MFRAAAKIIAQVNSMVGVEEMRNDDKEFSRHQDMSARVRIEALIRSHMCVGLAPPGFSPIEREAPVARYGDPDRHHKRGATDGR